MEIKATILRGQNGTKQLLRQYGEQLVCVRYRYDKARLKRFKTVELIVDEKEGIPNDYTPSDQLVELRIGYGETGLREQAGDGTSGILWEKPPGVAGVRPAVRS